MKKKTKNKEPKPKYIKSIDIKHAIEVSDILWRLVNDEITLKQVLIQMGRAWLWNGSGALTGLPIITNNISCQALENGLICKYVLDNWDDVSKKAVEYYAKLQEAKKEMEAK